MSENLKDFVDHIKNGKLGDAKISLAQALKEKQEARITEISKEV